MSIESLMKCLHNNLSPFSFKLFVISNKCGSECRNEPFIIKDTFSKLFDYCNRPFYSVRPLSFVPEKTRRDVLKDLIWIHFIKWVWPTTFNEKSFNIATWTKCRHAERQHFRFLFIAESWRYTQTLTTIECCIQSTDKCILNCNYIRRNVGMKIDVRQQQQNNNNNNNRFKYYVLTWSGNQKCPNVQREFVCNEIFTTMETPTISASRRKETKTHSSHSPSQSWPPEVRHVQHSPTTTVDNKLRWESCCFVF